MGAPSHTTDDAPGRRARAWARFKAAFDRPLVDSEHRLPAGVMWLNGLVALASLAGLAMLWAAHPGPIALGEVLLLTMLTALGTSLRVTFAEGIVFDTGDVFFAAACVLLEPRQVAVLIGLTAFLRIMAGRGSLQFALGDLTYVLLNGTVSLGAVLATGSIVDIDSPIGAGLAIAVVFVACEVVSTAWSVATLVIMQDAHDLAGRWRGAREQMAGVFHEEAVQVLAQAPMSLLGVIAYREVPWSMALLAVPYVVSWHSARQSARLAHAERAMGTDSLTGLNNRARFFDRATEEISVARRYNHGLALIMGDLDNFKRVNDTFGHLDGDEVLRRTATAIRSVANDAVFPTGRYGGEEFVIAVPVLAHDDVLKLAERVRTAVAESLGEWGTTISIGVSYLRADDRLESLIDRADKALYSAKYAGKNRVHEWPDGVTTLGSGPIASAA